MPSVHQGIDLPSPLEDGEYCEPPVTEMDDAGSEEQEEESPEVELAKQQEIINGPMWSELKNLDRQRTDTGKYYYVETKEEEIPCQVDWNEKYALCVVRHKLSDGNSPVQRITLQVNSPHLKSTLKEVIGDKYPGQSFSTKNVEIAYPYRVLYHWRQELQANSKDKPLGSEAAGHHELLMAFINDQFADTIEESNNLLPEGRVTFQNLWTIFRPGCLVYSTSMGQARVYKLKSYSYNCRTQDFDLEVRYVGFDGTEFGLCGSGLAVSAFAGSERIDSLEALPFSYHPDHIALRPKLIERGRLWESYAGMHVACYNGIAISKDNRYMISGRVMVDTATFHRIKPNRAFKVSAFPGSADKKRKRLINTSFAKENGEAKEPKRELQAKEQRFEPLADYQCLLATCMVRGFSFTEKKWVDMFVESLSPVDWNEQCFDQLVLADEQKDLVKALVATHTGGQNTFDDIVKHKGRGLVMVLHGPPGVGKTLTAETVAEYSKRPLFMVSSGDLGTSSSLLDEKLSRILDLASTWKAVLLIDEADVFLEKRSLHDLERNSLVSIFLRVLEYYEGILFLTTNRVNTFDDAFKSRIHVPLKYGDLTHESRVKIWKNFLAPMQESVEVDEAGFKHLARANLNGRQIKNVVRTAKSLAQFHHNKLDVKSLQQVINVQLQFQRELEIPVSQDH